MSDIPSLHLLHPEALPRSYGEIQSQLTPALSAALRQVTAQPATLPDAEMLSAVRAARAALSPPRWTVSARQSNKPVADSDSHDEYCRIERVSADETLDACAHSLLSAFEGLLTEAIEGGTSLSNQQWYQLRAAFRSTLRLLVGELAADPEWTDEQTVTPRRKGARECDPFARWIRGHHVFVALIQCEITTLNCFLAAHAAGEFGLGVYTLDLLRLLFDGSSAALHFAGNFSPAQYENEVRPTMMPPLVPPGMSGVLARDHDHLVHLLRSNRAVFANLEPALKTAYLRVVSAFENTYEAHKLVCSRFVGDEKPSLLSRHEKVAAAVEMLDRVKTTRLKSFHG